MPKSNKNKIEIKGTRRPGRNVLNNSKLLTSYVSDLDAKMIPWKKTRISENKKRIADSNQISVWKCMPKNIKMIINRISQKIIQK